MEPPQIVETTKVRWTWPRYRDPLKPWARLNTSLLHLVLFLTRVPTIFLVNSLFGAIPGIAIMLTGNATLHACGYHGYASNSYAAVAGTIGGAISYNIFALFVFSITVEASDLSWTGVALYLLKYLFETVLWMVFSTIAAAVGGAILWSYRERVDLGDSFNPAHAVAAGTVGAAIFAPFAAVSMRSCHNFAVEFLRTLPIMSSIWKALENRISSYWGSTRVEVTTTNVRTTNMSGCIEGGYCHELERDMIES